MQNKLLQLASVLAATASAVEIGVEIDVGACNKEMDAFEVCRDKFFYELKDEDWFDECTDDALENGLDACDIDICMAHIWARWS